MEQVNRALSIRQPYVEMIFRGKKNAEYRSRPTCIRERVYTYASKQLGDLDVYDLTGIDVDALLRGLIVGSVDVVGCKWSERDECYAWKLANRAARWPCAFPSVRVPS